MSKFVVLCGALLLFAVTASFWSRGATADDVLSAVVHRAELGGDCNIDIALSKGVGGIHHALVDGQLVYVAPDAAGGNGLRGEGDEILAVLQGECDEGRHSVALFFNDGTIVRAQFVGVTLKSQSVRRVPLGIKSYGLKILVRKLSETLRTPFVLYWVEQFGGRSVVTTVEEFSGSIEAELAVLAEWEDLTLSAVQDQIAGMLMNAGVSSATARTTGFVIKEVLAAADWLFF